METNTENKPENELQTDTLQCFSCHEDIETKRYRCFGAYEPGKKVYCETCFKEIKESLKKRWIEERLPVLRHEYEELQKDVEHATAKNKRHLKEIKAVFKFLNSQDQSMQNLSESVFLQEQLDNG